MLSACLLPVVLTAAGLVLDQAPSTYQKDYSPADGATVAVPLWTPEE